MHGNSRLINANRPNRLTSLNADLLDWTLKHFCRRKELSVAAYIKGADAHERVFASRTKTTAGKTVDARKLSR